MHAPVGCAGAAGGVPWRRPRATVVGTEADSPASSATAVLARAPEGLATASAARSAAGASHAAVVLASSASSSASERDGRPQHQDGACASPCTTIAAGDRSSTSPAAVAAGPSSAPAEVARAAGAATAAGAIRIRSSPPVDAADPASLRQRWTCARAPASEPPGAHNDDNAVPCDNGLAVSRMSTAAP